MSSKTRNLIRLAVILIAVVIVAIASGPNISNKFVTHTSLNTAINSGVASVTVLAPSGLTADVGQIQNVLWKAFNYSPATVSVAVIRKISDNPARYELVRTVAVATANDGAATWVPAPSDAGANTSIQVGCTLSAAACTAGISASPLAVINDGRYANTANLYQSIEATHNQ
ncbi:MAG: hypothetical protein KGI59_01195 [Patescibacteria group bacterium]|nr:hypothetical protein [Patescibacteria group bacterium]